MTESLETGWYRPLIKDYHHILVYSDKGVLTHALNIGRADRNLDFLDTPLGLLNKYHLISGSLHIEDTEIPYMELERFINEMRHTLWHSLVTGQLVLTPVVYKINEISVEITKKSSYLELFDD